MIHIQMTSEFIVLHTYLQLAGELYE